MNWRKAKNVVRWLLAPVLLLFLLRQVDLTDVWQVVKNFSAFKAVLVIFVLLISLSLNTVHWRRLLAAHSYRIDFFSLFKFRLIGLMYGNFLPSSFSGEMVRAYYLIRAKKVENSVAISTIIVEKISTLSVLFFYFVFALLLNVRILLADAKNFFYILGIIIVGLLVLVVVFFSKKFKRLVLKPLASLDFKVLNLFKKYYKAIHFYRDRPSLLLYSFLMSALIQAFSVLMNYLIARGLGINLGLVEIFFVMSLVLLANLIPASLGNWGWREGVYVYALALYGVDYNSALALALISRSLRLLLSLAGLIFAFGYKNIFKLKLKSIDS